MANTSPPASRPAFHRFALRIWRPLVFAGLIAIALFLYKNTDLKALPHLLRNYGAWGVLAYIVIYTMFVALGLPNLPFQLAAGVIYGPFLAFLMMYIGVNVGASIAFVLSRFLGRKSIEEFGGMRLKKLNDRINADRKGGFRLLLILRLIPLLPFNAINYAAGISRIRAKPYIFATLVGTLPLTFLHVWIGHCAGEASLQHGISLTSAQFWTNPKLFIPIAVLILFFLGSVFIRKRR